MRIRLLFSRIFITLGLAAMVSAASAQQKSFSDNEDFVGELNSFMGVKTSLNKELKTEVKAFTNKVETNVISGELRTQMIELMNAYLEHRSNPATHMLNLIKTFNVFCDKNKIQQFSVWHKYMMDYLKDRVSMTRVNDLTVFAYYLVKDNSIETSGSKSWYISNDNYRFSTTTDGD